MGTNSITNSGISTGQDILAAQVSQFFSAISVDWVPRDASGDATDQGGSLGDGTFNWASAYINSLIVPAGAELTIAAGVITVTGSNHPVDTQSDAGTDDLDTINGGVTDKILVLKAADSARTVVVKHNTGNIQIGSDFSLDNANDRIVLQYDGSNWVGLSTMSNGA